MFFLGFMATYLLLDVGTMGAMLEDYACICFEDATHGVRV